MARRRRSLLAALVAFVMVGGAAALPAAPAPGADLLGARVHADALAEAVRLAHAASASQAAALGLPAATPDLERHAAPSEAVRALLARHGAAPDAALQDQLASLDALPSPVAAALARLLDAFLAFDAAGREGYLAWPQAPVEGATFAIPAVLAPAYAKVIAARGLLLDAVVELRDALAVHEVVAPPLIVEGVLLVDLVPRPGLYTGFFALLVDAGGDDVYLNNAGGSNMGAFTCRGGGLLAPAALVDLGGSDRYGTPDHGCGVNGGSYGMPGFLLDAGGDDAYAGEHYGVNGGGTLAALCFGIFGCYNLIGVALGFLLDAGGADRYQARGFGANGGGGAGVGLLLDGDGSGRYEASVCGSNGGGCLGQGLLVDARGDDAYVVEDWRGTNGGGWFGSGFLADGGGRDTYTVGGVTCTDCTEVPKEYVGSGAQLDVPA